MAPWFFLYITIQKYFCWVYHWHHGIGFILLSMWILHLYFSEQYLILYAIYKFAVIFIWLKSWVHFLAQLRAHRPAASEPLTGGNRRLYPVGVAAALMQLNDDDDEMAASQRACFREVVEEVLAHLLVQAIGQRRRGTPAMARRRSS